MSWNKLDERQFVECPAGSAISMLESIYDKSTYDRKFKFGCNRVATTAQCSWTEYLNEYEKPVKGSCAGYIGGIESIHSNRFEDRRWRIQCCYSEDEIWKKKCTLTPYINAFEEKIDINLKPEELIVGLQSYYDNSHK